MPKRTSSKRGAVASRMRDRDLHSYAKNSPLLKFADQAAGSSAKTSPTKSAHKLRNSQANAIKELGRSLGYPEQKIEAAIWAPSGQAQDPHRFHDDEIEPIVEATRLPLKTSKTDLSHDIGLAEDLFWAVQDVKAFRRAREALSLIETAARHLKTLLSNDIAWNALSPRLTKLAHKLRNSQANAIKELSSSSADLTFSRGSLDMLICAAREAQTLSKPSALPSASDMIVARLLEVFERHFASRATTSRSDDATKQTPYLRFVEIVLRKTGLPNYDNETIIRATSKARKAKRVEAA